MFVVETAVRHTNSTGAHIRARIETDPLALRLAVQVYGEVGVDEQELSPRQCRRDAVAETPRGQGALQWCRSLTCDQRYGETHPHGRRSHLDKRSTRVTHLHARAMKRRIV